MKLIFLFWVSILLQSNLALAAGWIHIPAGDFLMGSTKQQIEQAYQISAQGYGYDGVRKMGWFDQEFPQHTATTQAFDIMQTPVTQAEYNQFIQDTHYPAPFVSVQTWQSYHLTHPYSHVLPYLWHKHSPPKNKGNHPVVLVNINDAKAYAQWLSKKMKANIQLPTEAQWEKAMRGNDGQLYPWGNVYDAKRLNNNDLGHFATTPVGSFPQGASPYGVLDAAGQVFEWTSSPWRQGDTFTVKGGSWDDHAGVCRPAAHHGRDANLKHILIGFRLVRIKE